MTALLLWYDCDDDLTTTAKIKDAARAFKRKYGSYPVTCYVSPNQEFESPVTIGKRAHITVEPKPYVMSCYFQVQDDE